nr:uncharacterized protein LOC111421056 [Onthophagus taurus]
MTASDIPGNSADVFITPPDDNRDITDVDSGDEDCCDPDKLSGMQLKAETELIIRDNRGEMEDDDSSPIEFWEVFISQEVVDMIVTQTNEYAKQKNDDKFCVSQEEIYVVLGVLYLSGYVPLPLATERQNGENPEFYKCSE